MAARAQDARLERRFPAAMAPLRKRTAATWLLPPALALAGCAQTPPPAPPAAAAPAPPPPAPAAPPPEVVHRAETDRIRALERECERLRADLRAAEDTLLAVESGMRGTQRRADAVSAVAEARIQVDRAAALAPWRQDEVAEARAKLDEADRQLAAEHIGSTIFFVSRASRIAASLVAEADLLARTPGARTVKAGRANLRSAPTSESEVLSVLPAGLPLFVENVRGEWSLVRTVSGRVGWVHSGLLRAL
jgi:hypothetical protein